MNLVFWWNKLTQLQREYNNNEEQIDISSKLKITNEWENKKPKGVAHHVWKLIESHKSNSQMM